VEAELALDTDGTFLALPASNLSNLGAYAASFVPLTKGTELMSSRPLRSVSGEPSDRR
jgi:carbon-monoxide dehydrogenase large subunit